MYHRIDTARYRLGFQLNSLYKTCFRNPNNFLAASIPHEAQAPSFPQIHELAASSLLIILATILQGRLNLRASQAISHLDTKLFVFQYLRIAVPNSHALLSNMW